MLPTHFSLSQQALLAALFTIGLYASTEVVAQSTPQNRTDQSSSSAKDSSNESLSEVVVTATKREVTLQKLPEAVTAITSEQLDQLNAQTFEDYFRTVPGLMMNQSPGPGTRNFDFSLRGISDFNNDSPQGTASTVGQYIDEIPVTAAGQQIDPRLIDIDHIEVLRGPQGTYFGEDSLGGTIRIITKKPDLQNFLGSVEGRVSDTQGGGVNDSESVMFNVPLIENALALRLNAFRAFDSGYINEICTASPSPFAPPQPQCPAVGDVIKQINPDRADGERAQLRFVPASWFSIDAEYIHSDSTADQAAFYEPAIGDLKIASTDLVNDLAVVDKDDLGNVTANFDLGWAQLVSASSWGQRSIDDAATGLAVEFHSFAQEVRLVSSPNWSDRWDYIGGVYYSRNNQSTAISEMGTQTIDLIKKEGALFGEVGYKFTPQLSARLGLREERLYTDFSEEYTGFSQESPIAMLPAAPPASNETPATTGRFVTTYDFTQETLMYGSVSRGFREGGINAGSYDPDLKGPGMGGTNPNVPLSFGPDTTTNYELGWKFSFPSLKATFNTSLYHINWQNMQAVGFAEAPGSPQGQQYFRNAGDAKVDGIELEGGLEILDGLRAQASLALMDPRITQAPPLPQDNPPSYYAPAYCSRGCPPQKGDEIPYVSKVSGSMSLNYQHPLGVADFSGFAVLSEQFTGTRYADFAATWRGPSQTPIQGCPVMVLGPCPVPLGPVSRTTTGATNPLFATVDQSFLTNLQFGIANRHWRISLFVDNLLNVRNQSFILPSGGPPTGNGNQLLVGRPRTGGLWVRWSF
jgi:iron complex outermembrane recepter protein